MYSKNMLPNGEYGLNPEDNTTSFDNFVGGIKVVF
jgi:hypothetical protein